MFARLACALTMMAGFVGPVPFADAGNSIGNRDQSPAEIHRYWTTERMSNAREMTKDGLAPRRTSPSAPETGAAASAPRHRPAWGAPSAIGKLYFRWRGSPATCSGAVIDTQSQRLVLTAAHCLKLYGTWGSRYLFVPAYDRGRRPFGSYTWKTLWTTGPWARDSSGYQDNYDMGVIVTRRTWNGKRIGDIVGSLPYETSPVRVGLTRMYGYPAGANRSMRLRQCISRTWAGPWYSFRLPGPAGIAGRCNMAAGSSGGPWMSSYRTTSGGRRWIVDGLTSTGIGNLRASPYFGSHFRRLIYDAENR